MKKSQLTKFLLTVIVSMQFVTLLLLLTTWGVVGERPGTVGGDSSVEKEDPTKNEEVKLSLRPIVSVRKLAISDLRIVRRLKQIWRELNESSSTATEDVQKILNT